MKESASRSYGHAAPSIGGRAPRSDRATPTSKIAGLNVIGAAPAASMDFDRSRVDQISVRVESTQVAKFIRLQIRRDPLECIDGNKERVFHRAVITPKAN